MYFPGFDGGAEWGGQAFDPESGLLYVNANEMPWIQTMVLLEEEDVPDHSLLSDVGESLYKVNCMVCHGEDRSGDAAGAYPSLIGVSERRDRSEIMEIIVNGKGFMTGFAYLSEDEREAIMAFILDERTPIADAHSFDLEKNRNRVPYSHTGYNRFVLPNGYPAVKPPWGTLSAIDVAEGTIKWQVPLGEFEKLTAMGIPKTGTENYGGPVVTSGGIVFIGASKDEHFRAFDKMTGEELWKYKLPAGGYATPSTYMIDGKQYVVIACGGGKMGTKYLHFVSIFIVVGTLFFEAFTVKSSMIRKEIAYLSKIDGLYGLGAILVLTFGLWMWLGDIGKPADFYSRNWILMMEIEGDKITIFYNVQNAAFRYSFSSNEEALIITSEAVLPDSRINAISLSDDGILEITGPLFGIGQDYIRASISELEAYKYDYLINEFGRWRGTKYGIFFELAPDRVSEFIWDGESYGVTVTEIDGKNFIRAIDNRKRVQFWEYVVKRNSLIVGFDEGVGEFERVNNDNIYILD
ncbi:quiA [Symbiodinium microadriaticum]|nr:quiA [Symbiodinium microadriaticum]